MARDASRVRAMIERSRLTHWIYPPVLLCATVTGVFYVLQHPVGLVRWALAGLVGAVVAWIMISVLFPSTSKRECPRCGTLGMRRTTARGTRGATCTQCGHEDPEQSSFLLAEEEDPLERAPARTGEHLTRAEALAARDHRRTVRS